MNYWYEIVLSKSARYILLLKMNHKFWIIRSREASFESNIGLEGVWSLILRTYTKEGQILIPHVYE